MPLPNRQHGRRSRPSHAAPQRLHPRSCCLLRPHRNRRSAKEGASRTLLRRPRRLERRWMGSHQVSVAHGVHPTLWNN